MSATLAELAERANTEYGLARQAERSMVLHAVQCGEALLAAHGRVPSGEWLQWINTNLTLAPTTAYKYMRLARHADKVRASGVVTVDNALAAIGDEPWHGRERLNAEQKREMVQLATRDGLTLKQVAAVFGVSESTAWYWTSAKNRAKRGTQRRRTRAEARLAAAALAREQQGRAVQAHGGPCAEGYALVRRAAQALDRAQAQASSRDAGIALRRAIGHLHSAEDEISRALGIEHGTTERAA